MDASGSTTRAAIHEIAIFIAKASSIIAEASQIPGAGPAVKAAKLIYNTVQDAGELKAKLLEISQDCTRLLEALVMHQKRLAGTLMQPPLHETIDALDLVRDVVSQYAAYGKFRTWIFRSTIQRNLEKCKKQVDVAIKSLEMETGLTTSSGVVKISTQLETMGEDTREVLHILQNSVLVTHMSPEEGAAEADRTYKIIANMHGTTKKSDRELRIGEIQVTRAQFNVVYLDLVRYLHEIKRRTGQCPQIRDLEGAISLDRGLIPAAEGDYTFVYRGHYLGVPVAVKALRGTERNADRARKRLLQETGIWPTLQHANIQTFIGMITSLTNCVALVSPWQENGNITEYCKRHPQANIFHLLAGAAAGLQYLHIEKSIVHGSLKGSNLLITTEGEAVVTDFSVAAVMDDISIMSASLHGPSITRTAASRRWQAVEVCTEGKRPTFKSDVWSMAMTIYEVITGNEPFRPELLDDIQVVLQLTHGRRPVRPLGDARMTELLWTFMMQCWDNAPDLRPDAAQIVERLKAEEGRDV